jgi:hypothetical protein
MTFDLVMTMTSFILGTILVSLNDFSSLLRYSFTSSLFKFYCVITVCKNLSVIKFLRRIRELRIVLDVLYKSTIFLMDLIGMMGIIVLFFAAIGIEMFGGVVNSSNIPNFEQIVEDPLEEGMEYYNFNDYLNAILTLWCIMLTGWINYLRISTFALPNRCKISFLS